MQRTLFFSGILLSLAACGDPAATPPLAVPAAPAPITQVMGIAIIEPGQRLVNLAAEQSGLVKTLETGVGQSLRAGQTILTLETDVERAQLAQANSRTAAQNEALSAARENLGLLEVKLAKARQDLARDEALFAGNAITRQQLDNTQAQIPDLEQQIKVQQANIRQQQSRLGELQADIRYYETLNSQKVVRAPSDGVLLSLDTRQGEYLDARTPFGIFAPAGPVIALTEIDELFADKIKVGQTAQISVQGSRELLTTGKVTLTSPYLRKKSLFSEKAGDLEDRRVREVHVQIDDPSKVLLGARVECLIKIQ